MQKLLESYKTLLHIGTQISFFSEVYETYRDNEEHLNQIKFKGHYSKLPFSKAISGSLQNYAIILLHSFMDEYNKEFIISKHPIYSDRIKRLRHIIKPAIKRLNMWSDIRKYRDYILAHNLRVKDISIFNSAFVPMHFNVPHTNAETILASQLVKIITTNISQEFPELVNQIDWKENILEKMIFNYPEINIQTEIHDICNQIENLKKSMNI